MNKNKFMKLLMTSLFVAGLAFSGALLAESKVAPVIQSNAENEVIEEELDLTTLPFSNTPVAGWGNVNINKACDGGSLIVNGKTYNKGIGTHPFNDPASTDGDIEYDISALSLAYEYFETKVAILDAGSNMLKFSVLVDGTERDFVFFRSNAGATYNDGEPMIIRCRIVGGSKLTLRVQATEWGYANGTCAFLEPRLYNLLGDQINASEMFERLTGSNGSGFSFITGSNQTQYLYPMLDKNVEAQPFSQYAPYGMPCMSKTGFGVHLKNATYDQYLADKTNNNLFVSFKFNIEDKNIRLFNTLIGLHSGCAGAHVEGYVDGLCVYTSGKILETDPGFIVNIDIPADSAEFELRVIADNGFGNGSTFIANAQFFRETTKLYGLFGYDSVIPDYTFGAARGTAWMGSELMMQDSEGSSVHAVNGLFIHQDFTYEFPVSDLIFDKLSGTIAAYSPETGHTNSNKLVATFTYSDGRKLVEESDEFNYTTSDIPFEFYFEPEDLVSIKLELTGVKACSASVINDPTFSVSNLRDVFASLQMNSWNGSATRDEGDCTLDYISTKALVSELDDEDLILFATSDNTFVASARARYEAWAVANNDPTPYGDRISFNQSSYNFLALTSNTESALITIIILSFMSVGLIASLSIILKKKKK